ncbi:MAG: tRNA uridine-5-carboxymethylaminomethyl(34) synthesis GTPase MnmE [Casimicrobiaceae bacterium]|nr:tRNA uridine-5-carboxymethylaminomethyl(34) synthesis GTPase MnmE [Casimicrobiaceae bacterium]MDW8313163.1 tRNA uridine-5-carboxymethylaminomethyl(34) synthesis GTPase MnmE [Burkholderiales bacterium]
MKDTIAAVATPPGRGGVGILRLSGPKVREIAAALLGREPKPRVATRARFLDAAGAPIDDGLALFFAAPASYTGEDVLELHAHGSPQVLRLLIDRATALGARLAEPGEFTRRAYLNGKLDLAQAEAVADLIDAATAAAARAAARSLTGEFSARIATLREAIIRLRMFVEATLDFPDEEVEFLEEARAREQLAETRAALEAVLAAARHGQRLHDGAVIVLAGPPNVGKSSLLNALAGEELAIVTPMAGTTRDPVRARLDLEGLPVEVIDTAGLRETADPVEAIGIERTRAAIAKADLALVMIEAGAPDPQATLAALKAELPATLPHLIVANKIDLAPGAALPEAAVPISAKTGAGLDRLRAALAERLGYTVREEGTFIARARHVAALERAAAHLAAAEPQLEHFALELFAEELRLAHNALGSILGEFTPDDLLGEIFARFCIGK